MFDGFFEPVPLWMILLLVIGAMYEIRRNKSQMGSTPKRRSKRKPIRSVVRRPKQNNFILKNYGRNFDQLLLTFNEKLSKHKTLQKAWNEATYDERDACSFHSYRFIQQFLNTRLAPTFLVELSNEKCGNLGAYDSPIDALCLKVYTNEEVVAEIELQPNSLDQPHQITIQAKIYQPEHFTYGTLSNFFKQVFFVNLKDDSSNYDIICSSVTESITSHLWNYHHGFSLALEEGTINYFGNEPLQLYCEGTGDHYHYFIDKLNKENVDPFKKEMDVIVRRMEIDGLEFMS